MCIAAGCGPRPTDEAPTTAPRDRAAGARSAPPAGAPTFDHLTIEDGLSQNAVNVLIQDRRGFVWIGTQDGLNRYDGSAFAVYRHDPFDPSTLSSSYITALFEDADGRIWVGTLDAGLCRLDPDSGAIVRFANTEPFEVTTIAQDPRGDLWVGTAGHGVLRLTRDRLGDPAAEPESFRPAAGDPQSLLGDSADVLYVDRRGDLWVGTNDGLNRLDATGGGFVRYPPPAGLLDGLFDMAVVSMAETADGTLWLGTALGLAPLPEAARRSATPVELSLPPRAMAPVAIHDLTAGADGHLWLATLRGLVRYDPATGSATSVRHDAADPRSLAGDLVKAVLWDRTGVLWVGTNGYGLDRYDAKSARFETIRRPADLPSPASGFSVRSLFEDTGGTLWIGAGVLYRYDRRTRRLALVGDAGAPGPPALRTEEVTHMVQDRQGRLWFAALGLHRYDPLTGQTRVYDYDPARPEGLTRRHVMGVFEDRRGAIWALTPHHISRLDDPEAGRFTHYRHTPDALASGLTPSVHEDATGRFWIATDAGLVRLDPATGRVRRFRTDPGDPASLSQNLVRCVTPDPVAPERVLWIGTAGGGLNRLDVRTGRFTHVTERDGLPNNVVYGVLPDAEGRLWLSTNRGLARYDPRSGAVRTYDANDGLQSDEFNAGAFGRGADGRLYFGGIHGVSTFVPETFADNPHVPPVVLTGLRIGDRPVAAGDSTGLLAREPWATDAIRLSHRENMVTFSFAALDFSAPAKNRFAYRMDGFDEAWIQAGTQRTATYTNLPPGRYTFRVRGSNNDGVWNEAGASLAVTVAPPPWRAWWAWLLYGALATALGAALVRDRRRRVRMRAQMEREHFEAEKLRELDQSRSRFFANVSHEFRTPLTLTLGPLDDLRAGIHGALSTPQSAQVDLARRNAARVLDLINQILDVARLEAGRTPLRAQPLDLGAFVAAVAQPFEALAARKAIAFEVLGPDAPVEIYADPAQLQQVVANLLSNAVKFTPEGGTVRVTMATADGEARVAVRDSGPGIPEADLPHVFDRFYQVGDARQTQLGTGIGLALAKEVVDLHRGTLDVASERGFGTTFTLSLPRGRAHLAPEQIATDTPWAPDGEQPALPEPSGDGQTAPPAGEPEPAPGPDVTTVLVVEDHPDVRAYIRRHLERGEPAYRVLEATDGQAGLAVARERLPDLVVSDVMMPGLDGLGLCRALKSDPETDFIPVILLTAKAAPEDRIDGLGEAADDYLTKPFEPAELRARIANLIGVRQRLRERFRQEGMALVLGDDPPMRTTPLLAESPVAISPEAADFLQQVRAAIEAHLGDDTFSVERLAGAVGVSRGHLHRQLKALADQTPSEMIWATRLARAEQLLARRAGSVSEVAYAVGFKNAGHFSDTFTEAYGCRPSAYAAPESAGDGA